MTKVHSCVLRVLGLAMALAVPLAGNPANTGMGDGVGEPGNGARSFDSNQHRKEIAFNPAAQTGDNQPAAVQVMRQVVTAYQSQTTYCDSGTLDVYPVDIHIRVQFETLFKRPGKLRFEWTITHSRPRGYKQHGVIWSDGASAWSSYSFRGNKLERKRSLEEAVAGASGASWSTAQVIPRLLSEGVGGPRLDELEELRILGDEMVDGVACIKVSGSLPSGTERTIWVGRQDHFIRKMEQRLKGAILKEVRTHIMVGQEISDSHFSYEGG